ncbi:MAG: sulfatase-like hydrolase/transferase [Tannerellaceae bacterium]|nr:sulfatase-like hydrolase/transferase [Tannerellaceae bacterium]
MKYPCLFISCGLVGVGLVSPLLLQAQQTAPNMVLILADDQGWGDLSIHGNLSVSTLHIDRVGREGAAFTNFYVCPVSSPTRAELLTGRYAARSGVRDVSEGGERINPDERTLADYLKQGGYATAAFGKWHNGTQYPYHPNARGFDEFYGFCSGHWGNYWNPLLERNGEIVYGDGFIIDDLTTHAIEYIRQHREQPFFVYLPYNTPHSPMQVPDTWWDLVEDREIRQRATDPEKEDLAFTRAALALTENIDWNVGRVMQTLEELGLDEHTIILYLTDNGPNSDRWNGGMKGRKGSTDVGALISLKAGKEELLARLTQPNDTPMTGAELDRVPRTESYMKGFAPFPLGTIRLDRQVREITLQAVDIPGKRVMDLFLLVLKRVN